MLPAVQWAEKFDRGDIPRLRRGPPNSVLGGGRQTFPRRNRVRIRKLVDLDRRDSGSAIGTRKAGGIGSGGSVTSPRVGVASGGVIDVAVRGMSLPADNEGGGSQQPSNETDFHSRRPHPRDPHVLADRYDRASGRLARQDRRGGRWQQRPLTSRPD